MSDDGYEDEDDTKKSVKINYVMLEKNTMNEYVCVSISSHDESTDKVFDRAKKQFDEMVEK